MNKQRYCCNDDRNRRTWRHKVQDGGDEMPPRTMSRLHVCVCVCLCERLYLTVLFYSPSEAPSQQDSQPAAAPGPLCFISLSMSELFFFLFFYYFWGRPPFQHQHWNRNCVQFLLFPWKFWLCLSFFSAKCIFPPGSHHTQVASSWGFSVFLFSWAK